MTFLTFQIVAYASISVCLYLIAFKKMDPAASVIDLIRNFKDNANDRINDMENPKSFRYEGDLNRPTPQSRINETRNKNKETVWQNKDGPISKQLPMLIDETPCEQRNFIVDRCLEHETCNGWADRQNGIISTFLMSLLTKRYFVINHTKPCGLDRYLLPNRYNWTECSEYISSLPRSHSEIGANSKGFTSAINETNFDEVFQSQVVFIRTAKKWTDNIMSHPKAAVNIPWAVGKSYAEINKLVLDILFRPVPKLEKDISLYMEKVGGRQKLICGHIRVGRNPSMPQDARRRAGGPNVTMILQFLKQYDVPSKYVVFVATDSEEVKQYVMEHFTSRFTVEMPIVHVDRLRTTDKSTACEGFHAVFIEQYVLSKCDLLVLTRSGLGVKAAYMSDKDQELYLYDLRSETIVKVTKDTIKPYYTHIPSKQGHKSGIPLIHI